MGFVFRRRASLGRHVWINFSTSMPSLSIRVGRVVWNSKRGLSTIRIARGVSYRDED